MSKVIIVGGGVAGMTAGIYARKNGLDCEIFERNSEVGGNLTAWQRNGCTIDNCMHWLNGTAPGNEWNRMWHEIGLLDDQIPLRHNALYESERNGERVGLFADPEETRRILINVSPKDKQEINRLINTVLTLSPIAAGEKKFLPRIGMLPHLPDLLLYRHLNLYALAKRFRHPLLRLLMTDYIGGEFCSLALLSVYAAFIGGNASLPRGGSLAAAKRIRAVCEQTGCSVHTGAFVSEITQECGRATGILLADGTHHPADYVIAACDPAVTFGQLLPADRMPKQMEQRLKDPKTPIFSALHTAFLCDLQAFRPFGTRIIDAPSFSSRSNGRLPIREFSHEPQFAPNGKTVLQTLVFLTKEEADAWISLAKRPQEYRKQKGIVAAQTQEAIAKAMPELKDSLHCLDVWTPATYHRYFGARSGAFLSYAFTPQTPLRQLPSRIPGLKRFSLATQWLSSPGGLPNAALAGKRAAEYATAELRRAKEYRQTAQCIQNPL